MLFAWLLLSALLVIVPNKHKNEYFYAVNVLSSLAIFHAILAIHIVQRPIQSPFCLHTLCPSVAHVAHLFHYYYYYYYHYCFCLAFNFTWQSQPTLFVHIAVPLASSSRFEILPIPYNNMSSNCCAALFHWHDIPKITDNCARPDSYCLASLVAMCQNSNNNNNHMEYSNL